MRLTKHGKVTIIATLMIAVITPIVYNYGCNNAVRLAQYYHTTTPYAQCYVELGGYVHAYDCQTGIYYASGKIEK